MHPFDPRSWALATRYSLLLVTHWYSPPAPPNAAPTRPAHGLLPPAHDDAVHYQRCLAQLRSKDKNIEKYIYLSQLKDADPSMFYRMCLANMAVCTV